MAKIQPITFPILGTATELNVLVLNFNTDANTCNTYYEVKTDEGVICVNGNYALTEQEFASWGSDNSYVDNLIANHLSLTIIS